MPSSSALFRRPCHAFSLIEAAIVLAIIGLVLGGIWVAASTVSENQKIARFSSQMTLIQKSLLQLYDKQDMSAFDLTTLTRSGIAPADMVSNGAVFTPWGNPINVVGADRDYVMLGVSDWNRRHCMSIWKSGRAIKQDMFVDSVSPGGDPYGGNTPHTASPGDVSAACQAALPYGNRVIQITISR